MGRKRTKNTDLPPHVYPRRLKSGRTLYYYQHQNGRREPLGDDYWRAIERSAQIATSVGAPVTLGAELETYRRDYLPTLAQSTQYYYSRSIVRLQAWVGRASYEDVKRVDLAKYVQKSSAKVRADNDIACLSSFWQWALDTGRTEVPNPRIGLRIPRPKTVLLPPTDQEFRAVYEAGDQILRDTLDLLYLTGQDVRNVLTWRREHVKDGWLDTTRVKTQHPIRIEIIDDLAEVIARCLGRPVASMYIVSDGRGQRVTYMQVWNRFKAAKLAAGVQFELRAIRRKTGSDAESLQAAQELLGHADTATTRRHYRKGEIVKPIKRRL